MGRGTRIEGKAKEKRRRGASKSRRITGNEGRESRNKVKREKATSQKIGDRKNKRRENFYRIMAGEERERESR